jgi:hypothetical protein
MSQDKSMWGPNHGGLLSFNINDGYLEALVRGYRAGILSHADYNNLCNCDTLDGTYILHSMFKHEVITTII